MLLLHKLIGLDFLEASYRRGEKEERNWFSGYCVYESKAEVVRRLVGGYPISCFRTNASETNEVHVAFSDGERRNATVSYLTVVYTTSRNHVREMGVHFCTMVLKTEEHSEDALVSKMEIPTLRSTACDYALMLPYRRKGEPSPYQQFTLMYSDWEVLTCHDPHKTKGPVPVDRGLFEHVTL